MERGKTAAILVAASTAAVFVPLLDYTFLNWDDQQVFVRNDALHAPGLVTWAFTTRYMEHYQPLAWLTWGAVERTIGLTPRTAHALNVLLHATCAALVYLLVRAGLTAGPYTRNRLSGRPEWAAALAALFWAVHPLRVEVVAWASAMPYSLGLLLALLATLAWINERHWTAVVLLALSLLARPIALGLPILWLVCAFAKARVPEPKFVLQFRHMKAAATGVLLAAIAAAAESSARLTASIEEFGIGPRLTLAAGAPWRYLWRTVAPVNLTPLDPLALTPRTDWTAVVLGLAAIALTSAAAWHWRRQHQGLALSWLAYLVLLAPAMGLVPSGLQATADRYTYLAAVPISIAIAEAIARIFRLKPEATGPKVTGPKVSGPKVTGPEATGPKVTGPKVAGPEATESEATGPEATGQMGTRRATISVVATIAVTVITLAVLTWRQREYWRDSVTLWTRAVEIDRRNDIALYNLATALAEAGRRDEALARYDQVLAIVPGHPEATRNRNLLHARSLEEDANRLAASGDLAAAVSRYAEAVRLDDQRTHAHAALGVALAQLGRFSEARPHLQIAVDRGVHDPAVPNALAYVLIQRDDPEAALAVLRDAQRKFPNDPNIARNIAILERR